MRKVVFFDRDGTLIIDKIYLNDPEAIEYLPGVFEGMQRLKQAGYEFIVVTNQSGVPRGLVQIENLDKIHENIKNEMKRHDLDILHFYYAPYLVESNHPMRKPGAGMLEAGIEAYNVDRQQSWMIGDRMTDVEAGHRAQVQSIFLHGTEDPKDSPFAVAEYDAQDFTGVVDYILKGKA